MLVNDTALCVTAYRGHAVSGRSVIGEGKQKLLPSLFDLDADESLEVSVELFVPITKLPAGTVTVKLVVNAKLSSRS